MKRLLLILILTFSFQSWTKADDVRDFEIEGMSIGDSALDYFSKDEINSNLVNFKEMTDKKFSTFTTKNLRSYELYEYIDIRFLTGSSNFIIHSIDAMNDYKREDMQKCYDLQNILEKELDKMFLNFEKRKGSFKSIYDETGKSIITAVYYDGKSGYVEISCYHFSENVSYSSGINVAVNSNEMREWLKMLRNN